MVQGAKEWRLRLSEAAVGSVAGSFPSSALQSVPHRQPGGRLGLKAGWWLPACVASVSEVLDTGVPHGHWGLVTKQVAERDPGSGQEAGQRLATLSWTADGGLRAPRLPGLAGAGP